MVYRGRIENGVVILDPPVVIAEGTQVEVFTLGSKSDTPAGSALERLAGRARDLPSDLAEHHDHYRRDKAQ